MEGKGLSETLLLWDAEGSPPEGQWIIALWCSFDKNDGSKMYSVPRLVELRASELRAQYLAWIHDFGEEVIDGKRLVDHLELRPGFSYWWMTLPSLASFGGTTPVYSAVRLLALEHLVRELGCKAITLVSGDHVLAETIRKWCDNAGLAFLWRRIGVKTKPVSFARQILKILPHPLQGLIYLLRHIKQRWVLRGNTGLFDRSYQGDITFVDYLIHLNPEDISQGRFSSNYWTKLINILCDGGVKTSWVHHYIPHSLIQSPLQAKNIIDKFNQQAAGLQSHVTLDKVLSLPVLWNVVRDYLRILVSGAKLCSMKRQLTPKGSDIDLEPLIREDWRKLMFGHVALSNLLFLNEFEFLLKHMPRQRLGIYIQENQPWELAFIHAWKSAGHGRLVGVPHTTVLFWDTRYYFDRRSYQRKGSNDLPMPSCVALNGPAAMIRYREGGYPEDQMIEVEALRYLYLKHLPSKCPPAEGDITKPLNVLILGDYFPDVTCHQMELLLAAACSLPPDTNYIVRPHPACTIKAGDYPSLHLHMTNAPLAELLVNCDVTFTSNITSAAVDAYCVGVPVVSVLDGNTFNMSPLCGLKGVAYITNPTELAAALSGAKQRERVLAEPYFCLDNELSRWGGVLGLE